MNPQCKICTHPQRAEIEWALGLGWAYRVIVDRYGGFSRQALTRHRGHRQHTAKTGEASGEFAQFAHPMKKDDDGASVERLGVAHSEFAEFAEPIKKEESVCTRRHIDAPPEGLDVNQDREHTVRQVLAILGEHTARSGGSMRVACEMALHRCWS
jgi:hypothetical protein